MLDRNDISVLNDEHVVLRIDAVAEFVNVVYSCAVFSPEVISRIVPVRKESVVVDKSLYLI